MPQKRKPEGNRDLAISWMRLQLSELTRMAIIRHFYSVDSQDLSRLDSAVSLLLFSVACVHFERVFLLYVN